MHLVTLIFNKYVTFIYDRLDDSISTFEGVRIHKEINKEDGCIQIDYELDEKTLKNYDVEHFIYQFRYRLANILSDRIVFDMEEKIASKILSNEYYYFTQKERKEILKCFKQLKDHEIHQYKDGVECRVSRKNFILQRIMEYLEGNTTFHVEGFVRFRLRKYIQTVSDHIDKAVEDFLMEKEYNEFIKLLRYFVEIQEAKINTVHVLRTQEGRYNLYDDDQHLIQNDYLEDLAMEMADKDISYDDLLISSLITLAPNKIVLHFDDNRQKKEILDTIKNVFSDRVYTCSGCKLCLAVQNLKQE